jgi:hypothetical protein
VSDEIKPSLKVTEEQMGQTKRKENFSISRSRLSMSKEKCTFR